MGSARDAVLAAMTEDDLQEACEGLAESLGYEYFHDRAVNRPDAHCNRPGFPDLVCVHPRTGRQLWAELKVGTNKLSPAQERWANALEQSEVRSGRVVTYVVVRPESLDRFGTLLQWAATDVPDLPWAGPSPAQMARAVRWLLDHTDATPADADIRTTLAMIEGG
jgi:hypothetical protein